MKISPLLAQFLINKKQLNLAGLGRFILDDAGGITFQHDASVKEDTELVSFIAESTGKMKSLVASDLDSNLELARQFLNIGKPYLFEGIGTLSKNKFGAFEFVQSNTTQEKKESVVEGRDKTSTTENSFTDYEEMFSPKKPKTPASKRIASWFIAIAGLSLAVFGGYLVYTKTKKKEEPAVVKQEEIKPIITPVTTPDSLPKPKDTAALISKPVDGPGMYRFVIEKAAKQRAFSRYNYLKENLIDVKMDTKDSVLFKLYFLLPATPADTAKKKDSLQRLYGTRGKTVIEFN